MPILLAEDHQRSAATHGHSKADAHDAHLHDDHPDPKTARAAAARTAADLRSACHVRHDRAASGTAPAAYSVSTANIAVIVCTKRSRFFAGAEARRRSTAASRWCRPANCGGQVRGAVGTIDGHDRDDGDIERDGDRHQRRRCGQISGPRRNSTMSMMTPNNARRFPSIMRPGLYTSPGEPPLMIDTADALTAFSDNALRASTLALDTEFMREKTYRAELCLLQIATLAMRCASIRSRCRTSRALAPLLTAPGTVKVMHAARQDLEVLLPAVGTGAAGVRHADRRRAGGLSRADRLCRARAPAARRGTRQGPHPRRLVAPPAVAGAAGIRARRRAPPRSRCAPAC